MDTVLDFRSFKPRFQNGLLYSIFEGLREGFSIKMIFGQDPGEVEVQFKQVNVKDFSWKTKKIDSNTWQVEVAKSPKAEGCCGICSTKT